MFGKLLKHEFRALFRKCVSIFLLIVAVSLGSTLMTKLTGNLFSSDNEVNFLGGIFSLVSGLSLILIAASTFIVLVLLINRFYTNFFKDEGYLTFTLPVKVSQLYNAKLLAGGIVLVCCAVVSIVVFIFSLMVLTSEQGKFLNTQMLDQMIIAVKAMFGELDTFDEVLTVIMFVIYLILSSIYSTILFYLAFTIGATSGKKHKVALGVVIYYAINMGCQFVNGIITGVFFGIYNLNNTIDNSIPTSLLLVLTISSALIATLLYYFNLKLLKNKLNLD